MASGIRERMQADLSAAIGARDRARVSVLRTTLAALSNAEAVDPTDLPASTAGQAEVDRRALTDLDVRAIVIRERDELRASADEMAALGQEAHATEQHGRADLLDGYLTDASE